MRRLIEKKNILFLLVLIGTFVISFSVFALELDWPTSPGGIDLNDKQSQTITFLIAYIYEWAMVIGGLATFIALVSAELSPQVLGLVIQKPMLIMLSQVCLAW